MISQNTPKASSQSTT